jgi:ABC-2 type transport system permease protein
MRSVNLVAVYVLWLREMKRFIRARSRIAGMIAMPFFFMAFFGMGFSSMAIEGLPGGLTYMDYLVPGIVGMSILFASSFAGISVLWDREFGFLKEIMVSPVRRVSIVTGRVLGGTTTAVLQGCLVALASLVLGFRVGLFPLLLAVLVMMLISAGFIGLGILLTSVVRDMHGFGMIMNLIMFPLFFLSGGLFPAANLPGWLMHVYYANPLTYGVDGLRAALIGFSSFPLMLDVAVLAGFSLVMVALSAYMFGRSDSV